MIEAENWTIAVKHYEGHPIPALLLAHQLMAIRQSLQRGCEGIPEAVAGLDLAIESLYLHTNFHKIGKGLYYCTIEGTITPDEEEKLRELGEAITN